VTAAVFRGPRAFRILVDVDEAGAVQAFVTGTATGAERLAELEQAHRLAGLVVSGREGPKARPALRAAMGVRYALSYVLVRICEELERWG
jgi:hypothetical protein